MKTEKLNTIGLSSEAKKSFLELFNHFHKGDTNYLKWGDVSPPDPKKIVSYDSLRDPSPTEMKDLLSKVAVIKLNGGLGTTMGCTGAKSLIEVRGGVSFFNAHVEQLKATNAKHNVDVPLILMNSFNTDSEMSNFLEQFQKEEKTDGKSPLEIYCFNQNKFPRIFAGELSPVAESDCEDPHSAWYPPGHGDFYEVIRDSGTLDKLLARGIRYATVSNADNMGATLDPRFLKLMDDTDTEFLMEVTAKTRMDVKGGTLIKYHGKLCLFEIAQCPPDKIEEFKSVVRFRYFNTNTIWIDLEALKRRLSLGRIPREIIVNRKSLMSKDGQTRRDVVQLETAIGAGISAFESLGVDVPRRRFRPVKSCNDLLLVQSDIFQFSNGHLSVNPERKFPEMPTIRLGPYFQSVSNYNNLFKRVPTLVHLDHLTITGRVRFADNLQLVGTVIVCVEDGEEMLLEGHLENKIIVKTSKGTYVHPY